MKNLKKVLALVVVFSMMLCSVAFAAFPDVAEDADYANAVNTLAALDIIGGDDLGNFNPDNTITRAEFTKIVCEMQGLKGDANKGVTAFADVAADHWASGYINMATNMGIINGMGDGTFAPSNPVTYEQAIKMIVVALGYEPMAAEKGGYPTGYLVAAQSCGLTKGIAAPAQADAAKRSLIAELVYNALDVPMMERVGYGSEASYEIKNGDEGARVTLLTSKFDVVKLGGVVIANEKVAINVTEDDKTAVGKKADGEITLLYDNNFKSTNTDFAVAENISKNTINANVAETNADDFFGVRVIAYLQENGKEYDVIAIVAEEGKSNVVTFSTLDIDAAKSGDDEIAYFESETARKSTVLDLADEIPVIWNSTYDATTDLDDVLAAGVAKITLTDWDADEVYDMIKVDEVAHYVVKAIDADIYTIETLDGDSLVLDPDEDEIKINVEDKDGAAVDFEDIAVGDVLAVLSDNGTLNPDEFMDVIVLGQNAVEGVVKSSGVTAGVQKVSIDGTQYKVGAECAEEIAVGNEGTFYLGSNGEIIAFDGSKASFGSYAIILNTDLVESGDWGNSAVRFINTDGVIDADTTFATTVKVVNGEGDYKNCKVDTALGDLLDGTEFDACVDFADLVEALPLPASYTDAELAARVVQVKVNANKEITQITFAGEETFDVSDIEEDAEYNATTNKFAGFGKINDSTLIFSINNNDIKKTRIASLDSFIDEADYTVVGFDKDDNGVYGAILVLDGGDSLAGSIKGMAIVTGISTTTDADGDEAIELTVVSNNEKDAKAILITNETGVDRDFNAEGTAMDLVDDMDLGSLLIYSADANGNVLTLASIANIDGDEYELVSAATVGDIAFVYGITAGKLTNDLAIEDGNADEIVISAATNKYRYNNANARNIRIEVGAYKGGNVVTANEDEGNFVFAMVVDDETIDIISIDARIEK